MAGPSRMPIGTRARHRRMRGHRGSKLEAGLALCCEPPPNDQPWAVRSRTHSRRCGTRTVAIAGRDTTPALVIGFAALAAAANCAFYYFAVGPLYLARGFDRSFWPAQSPSRPFGGLFLPSSCPGSPHANKTWCDHWIHPATNPDRAGSVLGIGIAVGVVVTATLYSVSFVDTTLDTSTSCLGP